MNDVPKADLSRLAISADQKSAIDEKRFSLSKHRTSLVFISGLLAGLLLNWIFANPSQPQHEEALDGTARLSNNAEVVAVSVLNASGYVVAQRQAAVSSKATGRLEKINVEEGDQVKTGQVLAQIENADVTSLVNQQRAAIDALDARLKFAQAELEDAKRSFQRAQQLKSQGVVSSSEWDTANARHQKAQAEVHVGQANLILAKAQLEKAEVDLSFTYIIAPFDGTVLTKNADVGEIVAPFGSSANSRAAVVTIADMLSLEVEADVSEANISKIFVGQDCEITLDSFPGKSYAGKVNKIVPTVDRAKATVLTKIKFVNKDESVLPEMSAKVTFKLKP